MKSHSQSFDHSNATIALSRQMEFTLAKLLLPVFSVVVLSLAGMSGTVKAQAPLEVNESEYLESRGLNVLVHHNHYSQWFGDQKLTGIEFIHHGARTVTNGDVRLSPTPEQWDPVPEFSERTVDSTAQRVEAALTYTDFDFSYSVSAEPEGDGVLVRVHLDEPVPEALEGRAGFSMEFLPSAYFEKTYVMDGEMGVLPRHPTGPMQHSDATERVEAAPLATGSTLVLAPEDAERRFMIDGRGHDLSLYDGRNRAQNGWYVVRSELPTGETGMVLEWYVEPNRMPDWAPTPVISHSQLGYHPDQRKVALLEMDPHYDAPDTARLLRLTTTGAYEEKMSGPAERWGTYLRYEYAEFDFTSVTEPGLYVIEYGEVRSDPFQIGTNVYDEKVWSSTLDTFMPVQMDHMFINDRYRVWHGASHMDDARQAPTDHMHFDLYRQKATTDTPYEPGEHIPGLNVGGWYDAGDYDIRTQSQASTVIDLVLAHETFDIEWDETTVEPDTRYVDLRRPDGVPDILQQIQHGTLQLLAQFRAVGHAIPGIVAPTLDQYTHLGDGSTKTDNLIYDPSLDSLEEEGNRSGRPDDRWAFTNVSTSLNYESAAALAAASRVLPVHNDSLAEEARKVAVDTWELEQNREPVRFQHGNTTGGPLEPAEVAATVELLVATDGEQKYANRLREMWPSLEENFARHAAPLARAHPYLDAAFQQEIEDAVEALAKEGDGEELFDNPFGVPISTGGWGSSGTVLRTAMQNHILYSAFPDLVDPDVTVNGFEYVLGRHPGSSTSLVSGIGTHTKTKAYGVNRADFSFIPGGIVPGPIVVGPDFPEMKEAWPYLWFDSEYVIPEAGLFIYVANAVEDLTSR